MGKKRPTDIVTDNAETTERGIENKLTDRQAVFLITT